ncbi:MAG: hypothetical protein JOZ10_16710 [Acidobacteria bacterium]|nr:hypothetical protein [Acidobacteriota bacterium]MBV9144976.1 hypothetical protein [Acidobacteriota bacterium]
MNHHYEAYVSGRREASRARFGKLQAFTGERWKLSASKRLFINQSVSWDLTILFWIAPKARL